MKKTFLITISTILILTIFAITVSAAGATATVDNKSCAKGGTVTLNVTVSGAPNASSGAVEVIYDDSKLELVEAKWNTDGALLSTFDKSTDKGAFAYQTSKSISGKVFSVTFKVLDNAPIGKTYVECNIQLKDGSNNVSVTNNKGSIDVTCKHNFSEKNNEFLASEATCTSPTMYYYACSICGEKGTTTYSDGSALAHTFDKQVATSDYLVNTVKCVNEAEYYYSCSCGAKGTEKFSGDASWSHNYSNNLFISTDGHWYACADCGNKNQYSSHVASNGVCSVCGFVISDDEHAHEYLFIKYDSIGHWSECDCGDKKDLAFHTYGDWVVNGESQSQTCSACGYVNTVSVPVDDNKDDIPPNNDDNKDDLPISNNDKGDSNALIVGVVTAVVSIGLTLLGVFIVNYIRKKPKEKSKQNDEIETDDIKEDTEENI